MDLKLVALIIYVLFALISAFGGVKINNQPVHPLIGLIIGPPIIIVIGLIFLVIGAIMASPFILIFVK